MTGNSGDGTRSSSSASAESIYNRLAGYRLARRYAAGKAVADIRRDGSDAGAGLLTGVAASVTRITDLGGARGPSPAVGAGLLPDVPYPDGYFDVVVALEVIEDLHHPEEFLTEAKRILKPDGVLVVSTPDRQTYSNERNYRDPAHRRELYAMEFEALLESRFERVRIYRQGAVSGGIILAPGGDVSGARIETAAHTPPEPAFGDGPPTTQFVLAVCGDAELPADEGSLLFLDLDRRVYDECDEYRESVGLLREEIQRMQETEVQAFQDAILLERREAAQLRAENARLKDRLAGIESSAAWQILQTYRRLRPGRAPKKSG